MSSFISLTILNLLMYPKILYPDEFKTGHKSATMVLFFENPAYDSDVLNHFNITSLDIDQAILNITSSYPKNVWMYFLLSECYKCPYAKMKMIHPNHHEILKVDTVYDVKWKLYDTDQGELINDNKQFCIVEPKLGHMGIYDLGITEQKGCFFRTVEEPVNINTALFLLLFIFCCFVIFNRGKVFYNRIRQRRQQNEEPNFDSNNELSSDELEKQKQKEMSKKRLKSLDTFRGISIVLMIFCNTGAGHYTWIEHATWNGLHIADLVFPCFLWIMGVCIPISIKSQVRRNLSKQQMLFTVFKRSVKLFLIGLCLGTVSGAKIETLRIFNVLQRFGIAYFFVTSFYILLNVNYEVPPQSRWRRIFLDVLQLLKQWVVMLGIIGIHLILIFCYPVPGCPTGYLGPGGKHDNAQFKKCIGGATGYLDRTILGLDHIYQRPTAAVIYDSGAFDPEGIFGCLLSIVHAFLGVQCGTTLMLFSEWKEKIIRWICWGTVLGLVGGILCKFSIEDGWIPINKNLWSLSFVCITTCVAFYLLAICFYLIDVKKWWGGTPFYYSGMNAILMYIGHTVAHKMLPWHWHIGLMNTHFMLLLAASWNTLLWMLIAYVLYRRKIFYTV